ncbi:MAG TPA: HPF/RaiA family ribosome-associated protein [Chthoniobacteraceae bacterium]|jgi:ribosome-associated translation inhibitor RaiA
MKLILTHRLHESSPSFTALVQEQIESLGETLQIDEARIVIECRPDASPAFRMTAHLVTPGPDVFAEAVDHTLRAALQKLIAQLESRIDHRLQKRAQNTKDHFKTASPAHLTPSTGRP